jgi:hypothetical protein
MQNYGKTATDPFFSLLLKEKDMIRLSRSADAKGTNLIGKVCLHFLVEIVRTHHEISPYDALVCKNFRILHLSTEFTFINVNTMCHSLCGIL